MSVLNQYVLKGTETVESKINEYYTLKGKYDETLKYNPDNKTCICCGDPGGTKWTTTTEDIVEPPENPKKIKVRCLKAECASKKCFNGKPFIKIFCATSEMKDKDIKTYLKNVEDAKLKIIKAKNNNLFFKTDVKEEDFNNLTNTLTSEIDLVNTVYNHIHMKPERVLKLTKLTNQFHEDCLVPFQQKIAEYNQTEEDELITDAIKLYTENIELVNEIRETKYDVTRVHHNLSTQICTLIQEFPASLHQKEYQTFQGKVIYFRTASDESYVQPAPLFPSANSNTKKRKPKTPPNNTTQKQKPTKQKDRDGDGDKNKQTEEKKQKREEEKKQKREEEKKRKREEQKRKREEKIQQSKKILDTLSNKPKKKKKFAPKTWHSLATKIRNKFFFIRDANIFFHDQADHIEWWEEFDPIRNFKDEIDSEDEMVWKDKVFRKFQSKFNNDIAQFDEWWDEIEEDNDEEEDNNDEEEDNDDEEEE